MSGLRDHILGDKALEWGKHIDNEIFNQYAAEYQRFKNRPRIVQGGKKWYIMKGNTIVANDLTQAEAEAFVKLMR